MNNEELWPQVLKRIEQKISKASYDTWFKATEFREIKGNNMIVDVKNEFQRDWLINQYKSQVKEILIELSGGEFEVSFVAETEPVAIQSEGGKTKYVSADELLKMIEHLEKRVSELEDEVNFLKS
ncbi:hypothetical protein CIL03_11215 [Virgibacillus indicus]|uniref:DnaA N-terminal domain-containing protein n=1 Tax=Virgibacillus indicus TaxID=2024554 RepID=A0A265NC52_9BACI|nr:DnaA N-terminal domain-containing protein [Virgibacillus indicus]OZU88846.1 hypothetical protein CIL03_11215 [Virgibacillus indicus]